MVNHPNRNKASQFQKGHDVCVYVYSPGPIAHAADWRKAKIMGPAKSEPGKFKVIFDNGDGAVFDAEHIRSLD